MASTAPAHDRILAAAKRLFARQGYLPTPTAQVAREAGTSESQLIKHFGSKDGLLDAIFQPIWSGLTERLTALAAGEPDPAARLAAFVGLFLRHVGQDEDLQRLMLFEGRRVVRAGEGALITTAFRAFVREVDGLLGEARAAGQLRHPLPVAAVRALLIGGLEGVLRDRMMGIESGRAPYSAHDVQVAADVLLKALLDPRPAAREAGAQRGNVRPRAGSARRGAALSRRSAAR